MSVCPSGGLRRASARWGKRYRRGKNKKKGHAPKAGAKTAPNSAMPSWWCLLFLCFLYSPLASPPPRCSRTADTNKQQRVIRSNKCRTFTFSSEGSAMSPPLPHHQPPVRAPIAIPALFDDGLFSSGSPVLISFLARVPARGSRPVTRAHVYATLLCTMIPPAQSTVSSASGFLALANFPLLNVNFDVIDGAATAWMLACSFCPLPYSLFSYPYRSWPYSCIFYCFFI